MQLEVSSLQLLRGPLQAVHDVQHPGTRDAAHSLHLWRIPDRVAEANVGADTQEGETVSGIQAVKFIKILYTNLHKKR